MKEKLIALLEKHANITDELLEIEEKIENLKNEIGETQATQILMDWLNSEIAEA
jgi:hypothetical protein